MQIAERTIHGLEYLQRIVAGESGNVPVGDLLGFRLVEVEGAEPSSRARRTSAHTT